MQDIREGRTCWIDHANHFTAVEALISDIECEVAIIGAGVSGSLIAHRLAKDGIDVCVFDRSQPGAGSTAACTALIQYDLDVPLIDLIKKCGEQHAQGAYRACVDALDILRRHVESLPQDCELKVRPSLLVARRKWDCRAMKHELAARQQLGIDVRWADAEELKRDWNIDRPGAIVSDDSLELDPYALSVQTLESARQLGAKVFAPVEIVWDELPLEPVASGSVRLNTTHGPTIQAKHVIIATGYQTPKCVRKNLGTLLSTWAACSEPIENLAQFWPKGQLLWEWGEAYLYARTRDDNTVIFGGGDRRFRNPMLRDALTETTIKKLTTQIESLVPGLQITPQFQWCGTFAQTNDGMPYIGQLPESKRHHIALGFGGNGVTFSVLAAEILVHAVKGERDPKNWSELFRLDR